MHKLRNIQILNDILDKSKMQYVNFLSFFIRVETKNCTDKFL